MPVLHAREGIRCTHITDEGAVLLDTRAGLFYGLNPAAAVIWAAVTSAGDGDGEPLDRATSAVVARFAVDDATAREDAHAHLALLIEQGLLEDSR
ncbi:PqqD family peptide modification chaperone [Nonomuraea sp. NPDC049504]|uniref:PqqD family peptide modification chaperone n=1 Tax=Nonomuraea sp. NPDC049504 TaxID=3154729 RepID=UPI003433C4B4